MDTFIYFIKKQMKTCMQKENNPFFPHQGFTGHFFLSSLTAATGLTCSLVQFVPVLYFQLNFLFLLEKEMDKKLLGCLRMKKCSFICVA